MSTNEWSHPRLEDETVPSAETRSSAGTAAETEPAGTAIWGKVGGGLLPPVAAEDEGQRAAAGTARDVGSGRAEDEDISSDQAEHDAGEDRGTREESGGRERLEPGDSAPADGRDERDGLGAGDERASGEGPVGPADGGGTAFEGETTGRTDDGGLGGLGRSGAQGRGSANAPGGADFGAEDRADGRAHAGAGGRTGADGRSGADDSGADDSGADDSGADDSAADDSAAGDPPDAAAVAEDGGTGDCSGGGGAEGRGVGGEDGSSATGGRGDEDGGDREAEEAEEAEEAGEAARRPRVLRWSRSPAAILVGVLIGLLGFGIAVQVRSNTSTSGLTAARQEDLVRILDDLSSREDRLRRQIADLEAARARLSSTGDTSSTALQEARKRSEALGILAGTVPAQGPGIVLTITDPDHRLAAEDLLDTVEELRAAGAEAIQVGGVRIGLDSSFTAADTGIAVDGVAVTVPYTILAIGDPPTLATAMGIPGGVADTAKRAGGEASIEQRQQVVIRALRPIRTPRYAQPTN